MKLARVWLFLAATLIPLRLEAFVTVTINTGGSCAACASASWSVFVFAGGTGGDHTYHQFPRSGCSAPVAPGSDTVYAGQDSYCQFVDSSTSSHKPWPADGGSITYSGCGNSDPPNNYCWSGCFTNNTTQPVAALVFFSGPGHSGAGPCSDVPPGQTYCYTFCTTNGPFSGAWQYTPGTCANPQYPITAFPGSNAYTNNPSGNQQNNNGLTGAPGSGPGSTGGPTWTPGSGSSTNNASSQDIQNLAGALVQALGVANAELAAIKSDLDTANTVAEAGTNILGASEGILGGATNLLDRIRTNTAGLGWVAGQTSNFWFAAGGPTNVGWFTTNMPTSATNAAAAYAAGTNAMGTTPSAIDGINSSWGSTNSGGSGSTNGMAINLGTAAGVPLVLNMDPASWSWGPTAMAFAKAGWTLIIIVWICNACGRQLWEVTQTMAGAETGGVPDLTGELFGIGGNVIGFAIALLIPAAFIALWKVCLDYFLSGAFSSLYGQTSAGISTFVGLGGNQIALYLLDQAFPTSLFLSCLVTRLALPFAATKVVVLATAASRFLFGK